jgi:hypothetical protein
MIAHMPSSDRSAAESNLQAAIARSAYRDGKWLNTADPSEVKLFELVRREIFRRTVPFIHTSTLSDQIGKDEADSIFLLGQYMARWNLPYVRRELQRARSIVAPN